MNGATAPTRRRAVLVVEDDRLTSDLLRTVVEDAGLRCVPASEGHLAVEFALAERPCLITLDLDLPDTDGHAVLHRLLADERTREIPIVVVSGYPGFLPDADRGRVAAVLAKPFDPDQLGSLLTRLVGAGERRDGAGRVERREHADGQR